MNLRRCFWGSLLIGVMIFINIFPAVVLAGNDYVYISAGQLLDFEGGKSKAAYKATLGDISGTVQAGAVIGIGDGQMMVDQGTFIADSGAVYSVSQCQATLTSAKPVSNPASAVQTVPQAQEQKIKVLLDGKTLNFSQAPIIQNGSVLVPFRKILEELGAIVEYNVTTRQIEAMCAKQGIAILFVPGDPKATIIHNGGKTETYTMNQPAVVINGSTLVPLRFIGENLGYEVNWDGASKTVTINNSGQASTNQASVLLHNGLDYLDAKNEAAAFPVLKQAADLGNVDAQTLVGHMYYDAKGTTQNYSEGQKYFLMAAKQGNPEGQYMMGVTYEMGYGVTKDMAQASDWWQKAVAQGHSRAQTLLGLMYLYGNYYSKDYSQALKLLTQAADQGEARGQSGLGLMYYNGWGVSKDLDKSLELFRKSADKGDSLGQLMLAGRYLTGEGVSKDYVEAVKWYRASAEQGEPEAQWFMGMAYLKGMGVSQDKEQAVLWFRKAADQGFAPAQESLNQLGR